MFKAHLEIVIFYTTKRVPHQNNNQKKLSLKSLFPKHIKTYFLNARQQIPNKQWVQLLRQRAT